MACALFLTFEAFRIKAPGEGQQPKDRCLGNWIVEPVLLDDGDGRMECELWYRRLGWAVCLLVFAMLCCLLAPLDRS